MPTKSLFVLIYIRNKGEVGAVKQVFKRPHVKKNCTDRSKAVLLLWILVAISVS